MIILEILLIPLLALVLIGMVFIVGVAGLADSVDSSGNNFSTGIDTEEILPILNLDSTNTLIPLPANDPAGFMFYQADRQRLVNGRLDVVESFHD